MNMLMPKNRCILLLFYISISYIDIPFKRISVVHILWLFKKIAGDLQTVWT